MILGDIVEHYVDLINGQPENYWGSLVIPRDLRAEAKFDPEEIMSCKERLLFVCPVVTSIDITNSNTRGGKIQSLTLTDSITVNLYIPFRTFGLRDVGAWAEIKELLDLRTRLDILVAKNTPEGHNLAEINAEPAIDLQADQRVWLTSTEVVLGRGSC